MKSSAFLAPSCDIRRMTSRMLMRAMAVASPDECAFRDDMHPTTYHHRLIAEEALDTLFHTGSGYIVNGVVEQADLGFTLPNGGDDGFAPAVPQASTAVPKKLSLVLLLVAFAAFRRSIPVSRLVTCCLALALLGTQFALAQIYRWDNGEVIPGTEGIEPGPRVQLDHRDLSFAQIGARLSGNTLSGVVDWNGANFERSNLTSARIGIASLINSNLSRTNLARAEISSVDLNGSDLSNANLASAAIWTATFTGANLSGAILTDARLNAVFRNADLSAADLTNARLNADLRNANFSGAIITGTALGDTRSSGLTNEQLYLTASYQQQNLQGVALSGDLSGWDFSGQDLRRARLEGALSGAIFSGANITGASLHGASREQMYSTASYQLRNLRRVQLSGDLSGWDFSNQDLTGGSLQGELTSANISGAIVTEAALRTATPQQIYSTASYKQKNLRGIGLGGDLTAADFSGQNLTSASLSGATLNRATFTGANLSRASLRAASMEGADFRGANLSNANLSSTSFRDANMSGATLANAHLRRADLSSANLSASDLTNAYLWGAELSSANLAGATISGASLQSSNFTKEQLYSTASHQLGNLQGIRLGGDRSGWNLSGQDLTNARFDGAILDDTDLSDACIGGAGFWEVTGLTKEQIYATASYQRGNLRRVSWFRTDLDGWDFSNQDLTGSRFFSEVTLDGSNFSGAIIAEAEFSGIDEGGLNREQFYSTASYYQKDLKGISIEGNLSSWDFSRQNLRGARLGGTLAGADFSSADLTDATLDRATLTDANFSDATISGISLADTTDSGFTEHLLASTASYQQRDLRRIGLDGNNLTGWDLSRQDLSGATFERTLLTNARLAGAEFANAAFAGAALAGADLTEADFSRADLRGATGFAPIPTTLTENTILPDGTIRGLNLADEERLSVRGGGLVTVRNEFAMADESILELEKSWFPTGVVVVVDPDATVHLGGTLRMIGRPRDIAANSINTIDLFEWNQELDAANRFDRIELPIVELLHWDLSRLYTTGELILYPGGTPDYHANGVVDQGDLDLVLLHWGEELFNPIAAGWINDLPSGAIDQGELDAVLLNWGNDVAAETSAQAAVLEPTTFGMLFVAAAMGAVKYVRRRVLAFRCPSRPA